MPEHLDRGDAAHDGVVAHHPQSIRDLPADRGEANGRSRPLDRGQCDPKNAAGGNEKAEGLRTERRPGSGHCDNTSGQCRADDANDAGRHLGHGQRRHELVRRDDHRHGGQLGWASEGIANGDQHCQERDLPGALGKGQQRDKSGPSEIGAKDDAAAIQTVGKDAGNRRQHHAREQLQDEDEAEQFRGAGQPVDEQRHRHEGDDFAQLGTELRQPEPPERRDGKHVSEPTAA